jgi:hypothetical protein
MAQQQQTVLRVQTNIPNYELNTGEGLLSPSISSGIGSFTGLGTLSDPFNVFVVSPGFFYAKDFIVRQDSSTVFVTVTGNTLVELNGDEFLSTTGTTGSAFVTANDYDDITIRLNNSDSVAQIYIIPSNQPFEFINLDLYGDIPIKINKSFAELQDISKRNSDYSVGLTIPGSKKNNSFFEGFFNVDNQTLFFDALRRVPCDVLINDQSYFRGYMKLNKVSVINSKVEYDVTLFSNVANLFGEIGNNLLKDLDFDGTLDLDLSFNHTFTNAVVSNWNYSIFSNDKEPNWFYPVVHNGYEYSATTDNDVIVNVSGATTGSTRLFTTTLASGYTSNAAAYAAGVQRYRINSPEDGIYDNQLKPALNVKRLVELIFSTYGYKIKSDFFNTPWFRLLYMYGYFSDDKTKFHYKLEKPQVLPQDGVDVLLYVPTGGTLQIIVVKQGTGVPCQCTVPLNVGVRFRYNTYPFTIFEYYYDIPPEKSGTTISYATSLTPISLTQSSQQSIGLAVKPLAYTPAAPNTVVPITDGEPVNFSQVITPDIKQIDFLSSIAKKFNLLFITNPDNPYEIIIEPYEFYVGTGVIHDWTDKLSFDNGFTVEPALNYVESEIMLTDLDDGDAGNKNFKDRNGRLYGQNLVYNPTDFKSDVKKIETIFSPEVIRTWDTSGTTNNGNVKLPLGINYAESTQTVGKDNSEKVVPTYKGAKTKPKLMYYLGTQNPFLDTYGEIIPTTGVTTTKFRILTSDGVSTRTATEVPIISHTMPIGNPDENKINNDSICNLFNSEQQTDIGVSTYNTFTEQDVYGLFYQNRISNIYDKNTRFLTGQFDIKLSDIINLSPKDLIKINEQYFTWNKIESYNLTNPELTKVQLVQVNNSVREYPTRYFQYYYCDAPSTIYRFKTDFTNPSLSGTSFGWSISYDYNVGVLGGDVSGYTSSIYDLQSGQGKYIPYNIYEVDKSTYESSGLDRDPNDTLWMFCVYTGFSSINGDLNYNNFRTQITDSGLTKSIMNVFTNCTDFSTIASANSVLTGSSTYHGSTPPSGIYSSGVTLNITDTGWIKYNSSVYPDGTYQYMGSLGNVDLGGCVQCSSINYGYPFADLAEFTVVDCGTTCP